MSWKEILKGEAGELQEQYGMGGDELVDYLTEGESKEVAVFGQGGEGILNGSPYDIKLEYEYRDDGNFHLMFGWPSFHKKGTKLEEWYKKVGYEIDENDIENYIELADQMGLEVSGDW